MSPAAPGVGTVALAYDRWRLFDEVVLQAALHPDRVAARAALLFQAAVQQLHAHRPGRRGAPDQVEYAVPALSEGIGRQCGVPLQGQLAEDQVRSPQLGPVVGIADEAAVQVQRVEAAIGTDHRVQPGAGQVGGIAAEAASSQRTEQQQIALAHRGRATQLQAAGHSPVALAIAVIGQAARHRAHLKVAPVALHARGHGYVRQTVHRSPLITGTGKFSLRVFGRHGQRAALAHREAVVDAGHQQIAGATRPGEVQRVGQAVRVHEAGVAIAGIGIAELSIRMPQPELVAIAAAEEVVLQIEAQVAVRGWTPRLEAEAGLLGVDVEVGDIAVAAAHRHRRGNELILVAGRARIGDGIQLGVTADADHRISAGYGKEPLQIRVGRARRTVRSRCRSGRISDRIALRQYRLRHTRHLGAMDHVGRGGRGHRRHCRRGRCLRRRSIALLKPVQPLLHAFQRLAHGGHLAPQCLRILCITLLSVRRRDRQCPQACQTQYGQTHCILP